MNNERRAQKFKLKKILRYSIFDIRYSIFLFLFLLLFSCSNPYKNLTSAKLSESEIKEIPYALPHSDKALIYKTDIAFYKNDISGLLIIKKTGNNIYRIALTTQFGLKIFDFELNQGELKVEYCVEYLDKKVILNTFQNDFNLILMQNAFQSARTLQAPGQNQKIWQFKDGKTSFNYIENTNLHKIENIHLSKRNSKKISVGLYSYSGDIPQEIKLVHHNIKLTMNLKLIQ